MTEAPASEKRIGLAYWMQQVLDQRGKLAENLGADPVHDLRTALRRCRSMADGIRVFDRHPAWKKMRKAGKALFTSLGDLRDTHVMGQWVEHLAPEGDATRKILADYMASQEQKLRNHAATALQSFDPKQWKNWTAELPRRCARIPIDSPVFAHLAVERWHEAHALHSQALRNRTKTAFHQLRIGIKHLRYTIENFLPRLHVEWGKDLKELQDLLGDVHDLDVLWQTAISIKAFRDAETRMRWQSRIQQERGQRLEAYREKMVGSNSLWPIWRARLPQPEELRPLAFARLQTWASFLDPEVAHAKHVADLALQLYDSSAVDGILRGPKRDSYRYILRAAALMHDVGRSRVKAGHHKASARLIRKLYPPLGWTADEIRIVALVARYHRGALPKVTQKRFAALPQSKQRLVQFLGGVLRLACASDREHDGQIRRFEVKGLDPVLTIQADGYTESSALAEHLAGARYLLELACHRPVLILPLAVDHRADAA